MRFKRFWNAAWIGLFAALLVMNLYDKSYAWAAFDVVFLVLMLVAVTFED